MNYFDENMNINKDLLNWKFYLINNSKLITDGINKEKDVIEYMKKNERDMYNNIIKKKSNNIPTSKLDHMLFRYICFNYINLINLIKLPKIKKESKNEAVFIEYRSFPHVEFLIKNAIYRLGENWCHTIICGNKNHSFMLNICNKISPEIRVIKTNHDNISVSEYNKLLTNSDFWNSLKGSKILIYQEDSFIFKNNIEEFMKWDYIGAPFLKNSNDTPNSVGNGGLSLRTKTVMLNVLNTISPTKTVYNSSTLNYMKNNNLNYPPEDVYFSKNMQELKIGNVANWNDASNFSSESHYNPKSFGGHKFWLFHKDWIKSMNYSVNFNKYEMKSDVDKYILYKKTNNKNIKSPIYSVDLNFVYSRKNHFDIDLLFYKKINKLENKYSTTFDLCNHFNNNGIYGLIYHPKQLMNLYPDIQIHTFYDELLIKMNNKYYNGNDFVNENIYKKSFDDLKDILIEKIVDKMNRISNSSLLLLVFIGNINVGKVLLDKILKYKNIQDFNIVFCFNSKTTYDFFETKIKDIFEISENYSIYISSEFGTDITSSLLTYYDISLQHNFKYIIKLHTKSIKNQFEELTNFLLYKPLEFMIKKYKTNLTNCIGNPNHYKNIDNADPFNKILMNKYKNEINKKYFVAGTIFLTENIIFDSIIKFVKNNNYNSYLLNNMYENNLINYDNSPIHFLERMFGIIKV